jgi:hypothetical protein
MSANPGQKETWFAATSSNSNQLDRLGIPGGYHSAVKVATTVTMSFTGSDYGYSAFMLGAGADDGQTTIYVAGGAAIPGSDLAELRIYDIAPRKVEAKAGNVYVFKKSS